MTSARNNPTVDPMKEPFLMYIISNFQKHCAKTALRPNITNLLDYMLTHELFNQHTIRRYVVINEYQSMKEIEKYENKTQTIKAIASRYQLHENTIWNIIQMNHHSQ